MADRPAVGKSQAPQFGDLEILKTAESATAVEKMYLSFGKKKRKHCDACKHFSGYTLQECKLYRSLACGKWERP